MDTYQEVIDGLERQKMARLVEIEKIDELIERTRILQASAGPTTGVGLPTTQLYRGLGIAEAATRLIKEKGEALSTREIAETLLARGMDTKSNNYSATVHSVLTNHDGFERTNKGKWQIK